MQIDLDDFYELIAVGKETKQRLTEWTVGVDAYRNILNEANVNPQIEVTAERELLIFYIPVISSIQLPKNRVILRSGKNTLGAFDLKLED